MHIVDRTKQRTRSALALMARDAHNQSRRLPRVKGNGESIKILAIRHMREYGLLASLGVIEWDTLVWRCLLAAELLREDLPEDVPPSLPILPVWPDRDAATTLDNRKSVELLWWIAEHGATIGFSEGHTNSSCYIIAEGRTVMVPMQNDTLGQKLLAMHECKVRHQRIQQRRQEDEQAHKQNLVQAEGDGTLEHRPCGWPLSVR